MSSALLSGIPVTSGRIVWPFSGLWHASLMLATPTLPSGPQVLLFDGVSWTCFAVRSLSFSGMRGVLVVGGFGGWGKPVPPKQYGQGAVPTAAVLTDAAVACGEPPPVGAVGTVPAFVRQGPPATAGSVLQQLLGDGWWVNQAGTVQCTPRLPKPVLSPFQAIALDGAPGIYTIATETPGDWIPGATFIGPTVSGTASRVSHALLPGTIRTEVMAA